MRAVQDAEQASQPRHGLVFGLQDGWVETNISCRLSIKMERNKLERSTQALLNDEEARLLSRVASKDRRAFELLYRAYYRRLTRFLEQVTRRPQLIDEILDDTMLVVWLKAHTFNGESRVSTWIFAIAYNKALKAMRRESRLLHLSLDTPIADVSHNPENELIEVQSRLRLQRMISGLSVEQRAVIELTYYHGCGYKEIATITGCPVNTVKTRMFHARRKLKAYLLAQPEERLLDAPFPLRRSGA
jgi:RNA polymerase sigma-70 factor (ECF subfamily)